MDYCFNLFVLWSFVEALGLFGENPLDSVLEVVMKGRRLFKRIWRGFRFSVATLIIIVVYVLFDYSYIIIFQVPF